jgi:E3 SUMO-protein ligase PIAS1
MLLYFVHVLIL